MSRTPRTAVLPLGVLLAALLLLLPLSATSSATPTPQATGASSRGLPHVTGKEAEAALERVQRAFSGRGQRADGSVTGRRGPGRTGELSMALRDLALARPSLSPADRRTADRLLARPTNGAGGDPVKYGSATWRYRCFSGTVFCIHWVTNGPHRISPADRNGDGVPDYVSYVLTTMKYVYNYETSTLGYRAPLKDSTTVGVYRGNPNTKYDIYLAELGDLGLYGYCAPEYRGPNPPLKQGGYCVLDNDYSPQEFGSPNFLDPMRVTAAHEFFHDIQYAYDVGEDSWFTEGTATWVEDEVFDSINDNLQYLQASPIRYPRSAVDYQTDLHRYGAWLFFKYAGEFLGDRDVVREMWEAADADQPGNPYSMQAVRSAVQARHDWKDFYAHFGLWNLLTSKAGTSYSERASYPTPIYRLSRFLSARSPDTGTIATTLRHTASAAIRVGPDDALPGNQKLKLSVKAPPGTGPGSVAILQTRYRDGTLGNLTLSLDSNGYVLTQTAFDPGTISSVVVLVANTSTAMTACGTVAGSDGYDLYSCGGRGVYDGSDVLVHLKLA